MKSNGPFYYYDGSAPPQQIYPGATGSINFSIEGENQKFPNIYLSKIKNPITKFFFTIWIDILLTNGIKIDDPRFSEVLDVIDFPDSDQTPMPFWDNIKLPIVTNINQQFNYLFQSYSGEKRNLSQTASVLLVDLWNFVFGDKIPSDIYESWVNKLADVMKQPTPNIEKFYNDYLTYINSKYDISKLLDCVLTRYNRCSLERVFACLLQINDKKQTLIGNIIGYCKWGITFAEKDNYKHLPLIKVWTGR
jgi:hypothetical protein